MTGPASSIPSVQAKYGLPVDVRYCARCASSNQRPSSVVEFSSDASRKKETLFFDAENVCAACRFFDKKKSIDWKARENELQTLLAKHRRTDGRYDCIVPGSGGKDSRFTAHLLKHEYGMNPLTVTWAPHQYTAIGWRNMQTWIDSGFDNVLFTPNGKTHRLLTRLAFLNLVHPFQPFILGQKNIGPRYSVLYDVPLVFYGEHLAEYGKGPDVPMMNPDFYSVEEIQLDKILFAGVSAEELIKTGQVTHQDLNPYLPMLKKRVKAAGTEVHHLSYYRNWDPQENYYYSVEKTGFEANTERTVGTYSKYTSMDDVLDHLHYYTTFAKFGIGRASYDAEQEVRTGKITREEAVALIRRYDGEYPAKAIPQILEYLGITQEIFERTIDGSRSAHLWENVEGQWRQRHPVS